MLQIVHLAKFYPPASGGIETHLQILARAQARLGMKVRVICVNHLNARGNDVTWRVATPTPSQIDWDEGVEVIRVGRSVSIARFEVCPQLLSILRQQAALRIDLFHLHTPNPTMLLAITMIGTKIPLVITHHSDIIRQKWLGMIFKPFERFIYNKAAAIIAASEQYFQDSRLLQENKDRVKVIPYGIDLKPFSDSSTEILADSKEFQKRYKPPIWLMVGRLVYYKGHEVAIRAMNNVKGTLIIIGHGPLQAKLQQLAIELQVNDRIIWLGEASAKMVKMAYRSATALWFPSIARSEAFGLVQVEAMASGCPVINTAIQGSGVSSVSQHDQTGLTISIKDSDALADASQKLIDDPRLRERLAREGPVRAKQEFDESLMNDRIESLYLKVIRPT
jgi:glycosyltransferase involved in cell wall biosynthesis